MPKKLPAEVKKLIDATMPPSHQFWWMRAVVLAVSLVSVPRQGTNLPPAQHTRIKIGDLDAPGEGYDLVIKGSPATHDLAEGDLVSIFGHEPVDATVLSDPRLLLMHNTGTFTRAYPDVIDKPWDHRSVIEHKYWLAARVPADRPHQLRIIGSAALILLGISFFITGGNPLGIVVLLLVAMIFFFMIGLPLLYAILMGKVIKRALAQEEFQGTTKARRGFSVLLSDLLQYRYISLTSLYQEMANAIHAYVKSHPDYNVGFVIQEQRGPGTQGRLIQ